MKQLVDSDTVSKKNGTTKGFSQGSVFIEEEEQKGHKVNGLSEDGTLTSLVTPHCVMNLRKAEVQNITKPLCHSETHMYKTISLSVLLEKLAFEIKDISRT